MNRTNMKIMGVLNALIDAALMLGIFIACSYGYLGTITGFRPDVWTEWLDYSLFVVSIFAGITVSIFGMLRAYENTYKDNLSKALPVIVVACTVQIAFITSVIYLAHQVDLSRGTLLLYYALSTFILCAEHWSVAHIMRRMRTNGLLRKTVVVVGCGKLAQGYAKSLKLDKTRRESILGFVGFGEKDKRRLGDRYLGHIESLEEFLATLPIEEIVIALDASHSSSVKEVIHLCDKYGTGLKVVPFYNEILPVNPRVEYFGHIHTMDIRSMPLDNLALAALKRLFDIITSLLIIICFSWLYIIVAIGVKLSSPGPILFKQERIGRNKKPFTMYKFRSMRVNDESTTAWSTNNDPRKTAFGSFIRKFSLDEFPQFFNVLFGHMSIVGPRPEIPHYVERFKEQVPLYMLRHQVRPGITGWAQVHGLRGDTSLEDRIDYDLHYIRHWSPWLDFKIFVKTIFGGFVNKEVLK